MPEGLELRLGKRLKLQSKVVAAALIFAAVCVLAIAVRRQFTGRDSRSASLSEKLSHQWQLYERAEATLVDRVRSGGRINRREWERLVQASGRFRWTARDREDLRRAHRQRIDARARAAREASRIDLDEVRKSGDVRRFCEQLPKGGMLHVHPTGTLKPETVAHLAGRGNPIVGKKGLAYPRAFHSRELAFLENYAGDARYLDFAADDQVRFQRLFVLPPETSDFRRFAAVFPLVTVLRQALPDDAWLVICDAFFLRAQAHRVRYVEFTMQVEATEAQARELEETARRAQERYGITLRVNAAFDRAASADENAARLRRLVAFLDSRPLPVVAGIDLSGEEAKHAALDSGQSLYGYLLGDRARRSRFRRTMHAGVGDMRNIRDAMLMDAERVGHATQAFADPVALEFAAFHQLPVEANLVSNVRLGYAKSFAAHPFLDLLRLGLRVSLSTDDEGILETELSNEFAAAITHTDITYAEVRQLVLNSIETSFAGPVEKEKLRSAVEGELASFEEEWSARGLTAGRVP
ncbi:MAG TPA: hypothetical protein VF683_10665, partial [Chthoniobacterales bacterium]